jgi:histidyl-tRNA synthetase
MSSSFTAPRGTQDFYPPDSGRWIELETRMHRLAARFGYGEIRTPLFESTGLFARGVGETTDIVEKEMYTFVDKGDREMTLRPEYTAPVVRAVLEHQLLAEGALRLYYIGPLFRYERPQKGRYRQFHQFGIECFGFAQPEADVEVISLAWDLVREHGITDAVLNLNSMGDDACRPRYRDALREHFAPHAEQLSPESQRRLERNPLRLLDSKDERDAPFVASAPTLEQFLCDACRRHFDAVRAYLSAAGIPYVVNPRIVRGLDYYNRTVFEIVSSVLGAQSTVCGGGRYDGLVKSLGGPDTPGVGFALGMERFLIMAEAAGGSREAPRRGYQAIALGDQARGVLFEIATALRARGLAAFMDYDDRKIKAHFKIADRNRARYALILGSQELAAGELVVRDLESRTERRVPLGKDVIAAIVESEG